MLTPNPARARAIAGIKNLLPLFVSTPLFIFLVGELE
jgi:hypothetical protein